MQQAALLQMRQAGALAGNAAEGGIVAEAHLRIGFVPQRLPAFDGLLIEPLGSGQHLVAVGHGPHRLGIEERIPLGIRPHAIGGALPLIEFAGLGQGLTRTGGHAGTAAVAERRLGHRIGSEFGVGQDEGEALQRAEAGCQKESAEANLQSARKALKRQKGQAHEELECAYEEAKRDVAMARYYRDAALLAEKITGWSLGLPPAQRFIVCSGGGPGIMAAASEGARRAGGISIGLNISLPFEQKPNPFQTRKYTFEFHYFFIRKFWFFYLARAFVVFPGGFGTCDELFEVLTLIQTRKTSKHMPVVMFGSSFWKEVIHFDAMVKWGVIDRDDLNLFQFADSVDDAFEYLKNELGRY